MMTKLIKPFWGRASVIESPVDEEQRESGLIVPYNHDGVEEYKRGIIIDVDQYWLEGSAEYSSAQLLQPGTVVYFKPGLKLGELYIIPLQDVLAFESAGD